MSDHVVAGTNARTAAFRLDVSLAKEGTATHKLLSLLSPNYLQSGRFVDGGLVTDHNIPLLERDLKLWKLTADKGDAVTLRKMAGYFGITREQDVFSISAALLEWIPPSIVPPPSSSADVEELKRLMERQLALQEQRRIEELKREEQRRIEEEKREEQRKRDREELLALQEQRRIEELKREEQRRIEEEKREEQRKRDREELLALQEQRRIEEEKREEQRKEETKSLVQSFVEQMRSPNTSTVSSADVFHNYVTESCLPVSFVPKHKASYGLRRLFLERIILDVNKSETRGLQPAWTDICARHFDPGKSEDCVEELKNSRRLLKDTHTTKILVQGKPVSPDLILRFVQYPNSSALVIFELKSQEGAFQPNQQGQMVDYLVRFMREQRTYRSCLFGVYMSGEWVQFFKCSGTPYAITASVPIRLNDPKEDFDGIDYFAGLLCAKDSDLGWMGTPKQVGGDGLSPLPLVTVLLDQRLGSGGYGDVYAGHLLGDDEPSKRAVLKEFKDKFSFLREKAFLSKFRDDQDLGGKIPLLISASFSSPDDDRPRLVVEPIGTHITERSKPKSKTNKLPLHTPISADICCELVDILKIVHDKGYVHGDIKLNNFFVHSDGRLTGKVFLNDWGSVRSLGEVVSSPGFPAYAPDDVLHCMSRGECYSAKREHDLYAVVCTVYCSTEGKSTWKEKYREYQGSENKSGGYKIIRGFWRVRKLDSRLKTMFDFALALNYDGLKESIGQYFDPPWVSSG